MAMRVELHEDGTAIFRSVTKEEAQLIWHALEAHKEKYLSGLDEMKATCIGGIEDEMFVYGEVASIAALQFHLTEDYQMPFRDELRKWLSL